MQFAASAPADEPTAPHSAVALPQSEPSTAPLGSPLCLDNARTAPEFWARGEYVAWAFSTGKLVEMAKEAYNSDLFNALLAFQDF